ncbi:sulfotransferase family protein [Novosphingobium resinovorum]
MRYLRVWESSQPCPPPSTVDGPDPRRGASASAADETLKGGSRTPSGIDGAMECQDLMALDFRSQIFQAFAQVPSYSQWLLETAHSGTYAYHKRTLRLLQWGEPARPWRLKAPTHMLYLNALDAAYPDARFVMTHRDPTDVMLSVATVYAEIIGKFTDHVDHAYIGELNVQCWSEAMTRAIAFREAATTIASSTSTSAPCRPTRSAKCAAFTTGWARRSRPPSRRPWPHGGRATPPPSAWPSPIPPASASTRRPCARFADYLNHMDQWAA